MACVCVSGWRDPIPIQTPTIKKNGQENKKIRDRVALRFCLPFLDVGILVCGGAVFPAIFIFSTHTHTANPFVSIVKILMLFAQIYGGNGGSTAKRRMKIIWNGMAGDSLILGFIYRIRFIDHAAKQFGRRKKKHMQHIRMQICTLPRQNGHVRRKFLKYEHEKYVRCLLKNNIV